MSDAIFHLFKGLLNERYLIQFNLLLGEFYFLDCNRKRVFVHVCACYIYLNEYDHELILKYFDYIKRNRRLLTVNERGYCLV